MMPALSIKKTLLKQADSLPQGTPIGNKQERNITSQHLTNVLPQRYRSHHPQRRRDKRGEEWRPEKKNFMSTMNP